MNQPQSTEQTLSGKRSGIRTVGFALAVLLLFLLLLPEIIRWALVEYLPQTGVGDVAIEDVDLNLFSGEAGLQGVRISREGASKLEVDRMSVDISWLKLLLGSIQIDSVALRGGRLAARETEQGSWEVVVPFSNAAGENTASAEGDTGAALPEVLIRQITVEQVAVAVKSQTASGDLLIDTMTVSNLASWGDIPIEVDVAAFWQQAPVNISATLYPWKDQPVYTSSLTIQKLPLDGINLSDGAPLQGSLTATVDLHVAMPDDSVRVTAESHVELENLQSRYRGIQLQHKRLDWQGQTQLLIPVSNGSQLEYRLTANLESAGLTMVDLNQQAELLSWGSLAVSGLVLDQTISVSFDTLKMRGLNVLAAGKSEEGFYTDDVQLIGFSLREAQQLVLERIAIAGGNYHLTITPDGKLKAESILSDLARRLSETSPAEAVAADDPALAELAAGQPQSAAEAKTEAAGGATIDQGAGESAVEKSTSPFRIKLDELQISDDTLVELHDQRFSVPVQEQLFIENLLLKDLDQISPDRESTLSLAAKIGEFSKVDIGGRFRLFADSVSVNLSGEFKAVELPPLSPYSEAYLGYHISRGQYDLDFDLAIAGGDIDLQNTLHLRQLKVKSVDPEQPQPLEKQLDAPLGLALDMLRDGKDNITLNVPIKGRLDDPDISVSSIVNGALGKAIKSGATNYLKFALQPYGAVLMAADYVGDKINTVKLDPLVFAIGSDALPDQPDYLEKLLVLLGERPAIELTLCGQANAEDRRVLLQKHAHAEAQVDAEVIKLAERRAKTVKRFFTEKGVKSQRLLLCQARYRAEGIGGVQLKM